MSPELATRVSTWYQKYTKIVWNKQTDLDMSANMQRERNAILKIAMW